MFWCGGWDSNPRRPTPSGPQPESRINNNGNFTHGFPHYDSDTLNDFYNYCLKTASESTCKQYLTYIQKPYNENNKWSKLAWKKFAKFLGNEDLWSMIKLESSNPDTYVPSESEVYETIVKAEEPYKQVYIVLLQSGLRLNEAIYLLNNVDKLKYVKMNGFVRFNLSMFRGSKTALWGYLISKPPKVLITAKDISYYSRVNGLLAPKYFRKFVATKMLMLDIPSQAVDFIQGRVARNILERHYLDRLVLADKHYPKYAEWVKSFLDKLI